MVFKGLKKRLVELEIGGRILAIQTTTVLKWKFNIKFIFKIFKKKN